MNKLFSSHWVNGILTTKMFTEETLNEVFDLFFYQLLVEINDSRWGYSNTMKLTFNMINRKINYFKNNENDKHENFN